MQDTTARPSDLDRVDGFFLQAHGEQRATSNEQRAATGEHALTVTEFGAVLDVVAGHAASAAGAARILSLRPFIDRADILGEHARVEAMRALVAAEDGWPAHAIPELAAPLARLRVPGTGWSGLELRAAVTLLVSSRLTRELLTDEKLADHIKTPLAPLALALVVDKATETQIDRVVNDEGVVRDDASPTLRRVRRELRGAEGELVKLLERMMAKLEANHRVDDASVTVRNGRYVIPVRREGRGAVGGIVHDTSASGATVFVEPPAAVEAGNRIRELEAEEMREVERVLLEVTERLRPQREQLLETLDALVALDSLFGRARYALAFACAPATLATPRAGFSIVHGRHPLLLARNAEKVVPFSLEMSPGESTLLVSGPNTGGKTVLLKAIALLSLLVQSGVPAPAAPESRIPVFDRFFADIGDEQSIAASLSTFSAHLKNLTEIVRESTAETLVLIDELGSGTDPLEGAALGGAILETLTRRGTTTVATTHLGALKELAQEVPGVVNASLQFDAVALAPTYRLIKGIPGRSYGLSIARRLGMPEDVLVNAEARVPTAERDLTALLEDLERRADALQAREADVAARDEATRSDERKVAERERAVKAAERESEKKARQEARRYLLDARAEIDATLAALRAAGAAEIESLGAEARRAAEQGAAAQAAALDAIDQAERAERDAAHASVPGAGPVVAGATVAVASLGGKAGTVIEVRGADAVVAVGAMKLTVPVKSLRTVSRKKLEPVERAVAMTGDQPEIEVQREVDVRGMRVSEVDDAVTHAVDRAIRADLALLTIIHGKGTGALRERVTHLLKSDRRIKGYRLGAWNEGGAGVTIVELT